MMCAVIMLLYQWLHNQESGSSLSPTPEDPSTLAADMKVAKAMKPMVQ